MPPQLSCSAGYRRWAAALPGRQLRPPAASPTGFVAATRMLAKLSLVSGRVFPLPCTAGIRATDAAQQPAAAPAVECQQVTATAASGVAEVQPPADGHVSAASDALASSMDIGVQPFIVMLLFWAPRGCAIHMSLGPRCTCWLAGGMQAELLAERPRLRQALAALAADPALGPLLACKPSAVDLAHRAASWQRTWQPRLAQQLKAEQHADRSVQTAAPRQPSMPLQQQQAFQPGAPPLASQPQCQVLPLQQAAQPMQVTPLPKQRDGAGTAKSSTDG